MRLLAKTTLLYLLITGIVFLAGGIIFYSSLRSIMDEEVTEHLYFEKARIEAFAKEKDTIPAATITAFDFITITPAALPVKESTRDTFIDNGDEFVPYRQLIFPLEAGGKQYTAMVSKALFENDDLVETILSSFAVLAVILLVVTIAANRFVSGKLWKPFFSTLGTLRTYRINGKEPPRFEKTGTKEFRELNDALEQMTVRIEADYRNLKSFTENASHELQTPLAVITTSTEQLLQAEHMDEKQRQTVERIHQTAYRLSRLNQALLLLAKIENRQFVQKEPVDLSELLETKLRLYADLAGHKEIAVEKQVEANVTIHIHPALADIIVSNLLTNAIRHNRKGGAIRVLLDREKLVVCNTGEPLQGNPERLFDRFYKENPSSESTGLGLALVKQAAEAGELSVSYSYKNNMHCFEVSGCPEFLQDQVVRL